MPEDPIEKDVSRLALIGGMIGIIVGVSSGRGPGRVPGVESKCIKGSTLTQLAAMLWRPLNECTPNLFVTLEN